MDSILIDMFGHAIHPGEIIGIGPLMKRQTDNPVQNDSFNPWKAYFNLHLRSYSLLIESEFYELDRLHEREGFEAWAEQYHIFRAFIIHKLSIHQNINKMDFFKKIHELIIGEAVSMRLMEKDGKITIEVIPDSVKNIEPLRLIGTPEELDEGFIDNIRKPMEVITGLQSNAEKFVKEVEASKGGASGSSSTVKGGDKPKRQSSAKTVKEPPEKDSAKKDESEQEGSFKVGDAVVYESPGVLRGKKGSVTCTTNQHESGNIDVDFEGEGVKMVSPDDLKPWVLESGEPVVQTDAPILPASVKPGPPKPGIPKPVAAAPEAATSELFNAATS